MSVTTSSLPSIITANTYFWKSCANADGRRRNEQRHAQTVASFLENNGFAAVGNGKFAKGECVVEFSYSESCKNVYKHFSVTIAGKRSNVRGLAKFLN